MAFDVGADAYDKFMGRYSVQLSPQFADFGGVAAGDHVLDVGSGPGALTAELLQRGAVVSAADPSPQFVAAARERYPDVDVQQATAEELPYADGSFDEVLAQLVVHFMAEPVHGLSEMARVTRNGGVVAACVWDIAGDRAPITPYWQAAKALDPTTQDERRAGAGEGQLPELFRQAGLEDVEETPLPVHVQHPTFEEWWLPFTLPLMATSPPQLQFQPMV